ncbi:AAA domain-containing protein [Flavonifractor plautii]|uniref:AAA domain-containing protein n=1 Tax=Flavonifractor plautii TaxID=292800 RepID=A0A6I2RA65_FLAPL|nr:ATP-dependent Clp protease ATP-binding subunit [Flavonifractor plautii]MDB7904021.1 ATP-dependent Clp protease ATP-binding subunit [Flavonifractor plautii]MDU6201203.1 ATP-dependent Clp protease ATP-binding subunit [Flavonifractor plautii]MSB01754.1 AAA domain-containing protein [Flavonifractor plautii]MSB06062.1 AAA domain-containing protein [Flavonifractor plautii]MSB18115.1 AAA domain-containing protein [Flavonifractor plautii]
MAVIFIQKMEGGTTKSEGLCLKCAKEMGIKPVEDMMQKMGISDEDLEGLTNEMMSAFGGAEGMEGLMSAEEADEDEEDEGKTATFPFLNKLFGSAQSPQAQPPEREQPRAERGDKDKKGEKQPKRKFLENYCISLTQKAADGKLDRIIGRDEEIQRTIQILNRRQKNNPCLIGEPGVGKTAIAEGLAQKIYQRDVPYKLLDKEVYLLDLTALVAGTQFRGQFESRMKGLIEEIKKLGNIILVIDEVHNIVGAGDAEGSMNAANILKPALSRGEIQVIGATTLTEYRKYIEKDSALERRFQPVMVEEPSIDDSIRIIQGIAPYYEKYHFVSISPEMCRLAVTMSERYITDRFLPDKAIDLIDEACSDVNLHNKTLAREVEVKKELEALEKERENLMVEANDRDYKRQTTLKNNEQRQTEIRRELNKLTAEHDSLMGNPATTEALAANEQRQSNFRRELENLAGEREKLLSDEGSSRDYERLASIKSREIQLQDELNKLEAQSAPPLTVEHLARVIELWTKIPASQIQEAEYERLAKLEDRLKEHLIGQDEAVHAVAAAVRRGRVGIASKRKPVSFIFVGSTGVGKTELVKRLAMDMFHSPESLIRLDMSEFMEKFAVSRIIGSPPGYVGYDEAGQLTEKVRRKPYCVILFDEIEKAHPDVLNILLQILDDGHITDAQGRNVNFENTVIVMTSNAGSDARTSAGSVGFGRTADQQGRERAMKALESFLRPEFINRVDEIVYFNKLTEDNFKAIAAIMLRELQDALKEKGITFTWDDALLDYLVKKSYSMTYGARNLRRQIQKDLEDDIATKLIDSYLHPIQSIHASADGEHPVLTAE